MKGHHIYVDHTLAIRKIARDNDLDPETVRKIVDMFFGGTGISGRLKNMQRVHLKNCVNFEVSKSGMLILSRKILAQKRNYTKKNRAKSRRFNHFKKLERQYYSKIFWYWRDV